MKIFTLLVLFIPLSNAFVPFIDGGKGMPKLYDGWFNEQIAKQAATAMSKAIAAGKVRWIEGRILIHCLQMCVSHFIIPSFNYIEKD